MYTVLCNFCSIRLRRPESNYYLCLLSFVSLLIEIQQLYLIGSLLGLTSLASLAQDETFQSLASLARLFPKVSQNIILFFGMFLAGKCFRNTWNSRFWRKLSHKNAIKIVWGVIFKFMPTLTPRLVTIRIFFSKKFQFIKKVSLKISIF